jgi:hypothetical protein
MELALWLQLAPVSLALWALMLKLRSAGPAARSL